MQPGVIIFTNFETGISSSFPPPQVVQVQVISGELATNLIIGVKF